MRTAKTYQTGWMPRQIEVFAWRSGHFVCFVMQRLILKTLLNLVDSSNLVHWISLFVILGVSGVHFYFVFDRKSCMQL